MKKQLKKYLIIPGVLVALFSVYPVEFTLPSSALKAEVTYKEKRLFFPALADRLSAAVLKFTAIK